MKWKLKRLIDNSKFEGNIFRCFTSGELNILYNILLSVEDILITFDEFTCKSYFGQNNKIFKIEGLKFHSISRPGYIVKTILIYMSRYHPSPGLEIRLYMKKE